MRSLGIGAGVVAAWLCAAWAVFWSAFCIGSACGDRPVVEWWAWLALAGAVAGTALVWKRPRAGAALLALPVVVVVVWAFAV